MNKRYLFICTVILAPILIFVILLNTNDIFNNALDAGAWSFVKHELISDRVKDIIIEGVSTVKFNSENEKKAFAISLLKDSTFYKSNWRKEGPTGVPVVVKLDNNKELVFVWWGNSIFEYSAFGRQILIKNEEIGKTVKEIYGEFK